MQNNGSCREPHITLSLSYYALQCPVTLILCPTMCTSPSAHLTWAGLPPLARCFVRTPRRLLTARPAVARRAARCAGVQLQLSLARPRECRTPARARSQRPAGWPPPAKHHFKRCTGKAAHQLTADKVTYSGLLQFFIFKTLQQDMASARSASLAGPAPGYQLGLLQPQVLQGALARVRLAQRVVRPGLSARDGRRNALHQLLKLLAGSRSGVAWCVQGEKARDLRAPSAASEQGQPSRAC